MLINISLRQTIINPLTQSAQAARFLPRSRLVRSPSGRSASTVRELHASQPDLGSSAHRIGGRPVEWSAARVRQNLDICFLVTPRWSSPCVQHHH